MPLIPSAKEIARAAKRRVKRGKPVKPSRAEEVRLRRAMNNLWRDVLLPATDRIKQLVRDKVSPSEIAEEIERSLRAADAGYGRDVSGIVDRWTLAVDRDVQNALHRTMQDALGVDILPVLQQPAVANALDLAGTQAVMLIKTIPQEYLGKVAEAVADNFAGRPLLEGRSLLQQIQHVGGVSQRRARLIARDQTSKLTAALNQHRQQAIGIETYYWRTVKDQRVVGNPSGVSPVGNDKHGDHYHMAGKLFRWDDPTVYSDDHGKTWRKRPATWSKRTPGEDIQCFPGTSKINFSNGCDKLWRSYFTGNLVTLLTTGGIDMEATPNHPILTDKGWLPMNEIQEGDYLVQALSHGPQVTKRHPDTCVTTFAKAFETFAEVCGATTTSAKSDFYGDITDGNIDAVNIKSFLSDYLKSTRLQSVAQFLFATTVSSARCVASFFAQLGSFQTYLAPSFWGPATHNSITGFGQCSTSFVREGTHADEVGLSTSAQREIVVSYDPLNDAPNHPKRLSNTGGTFTSRVAFHNSILREIVTAIVAARNNFLNNSPPSPERLAEVVRMTTKSDGHIFELDTFRYQLVRVCKKSFREFSGHVYTLQSFSGYYSVTNANLVAKNCRCFAEPVINPADIIAKATAERR